MNKKISLRNADTREEAIRLAQYDRLKEGGRKGKSARKGGNRRRGTWRDAAVIEESDPIDDLEFDAVVEWEDWRFYSIEQGCDVEFVNDIELPYAVDSEVLIIKEQPTHIIFAMIFGEKVVLDTVVNDELAEEFTNFLSHQPRREQIRSAKSYAAAQWWEDDVNDIKAAGYKVL